MVRIFESAGHWYISGLGTMFNTEAEARAMSRKVTFVEGVQSLSEELATVTRKVRDLKRVYVDRGYAVDGEDPITNIDIESTGITVVRLDACIAMFKQLLYFTDNSPVLQGDYGKTVSQMRRDV